MKNRWRHPGHITPGTPGEGYIGVPEHFNFHEFAIPIKALPGSGTHEPPVRTGEPLKPWMPSPPHHRLLALKKLHLPTLKQLVRNPKEAVAPLIKHIEEQIPLPHVEHPYREVAKKIRQEHLAIHYAGLQAVNPKAAQRFLSNFCKRHYKALGYGSADECVKSIESKAQTMEKEIQEKIQEIAKTLAKREEEIRAKLPEIIKHARSIGLTVRMLPREATEQVLKNYCHGNEILVFKDSVYQCKNGEPERLL